MSLYNCAQGYWLVICRASAGQHYNKTWLPSCFVACLNTLVAFRKNVGKIIYFLSIHPSLFIDLDISFLIVITNAEKGGRAAVCVPFLCVASSSTSFFSSRIKDKHSVLDLCSCLSVYLCIYVSMYLSIYLSIYLSMTVKHNVGVLYMYYYRFFSDLTAVYLYL